MMAKKKIKKGIKNTITPKAGVQNNIKPVTACDMWISFDVSFVGLFNFIDTKNFTNKLADEKDFNEKFLSLIEFIQQIKRKNFYKELIRDNGMRHCHVLKGDKYTQTKQYVQMSLKGLVDNPEDTWNQLFGDEKLYQIGFEDALRCVGIYSDSTSTFHIILFDWHHLIYPDERRNRVNKRNLRYSLINKSFG